MQWTVSPLYPACFGCKTGYQDSTCDPDICCSTTAVHPRAQVNSKRYDTPPSEQHRLILLSHRCLRIHVQKYGLINTQICHKLWNQCNAVTGSCAWSDVEMNSDSTDKTDVADKDGERIWTAKLRNTARSNSQWIKLACRRPNSCPATKYSALLWDYMDGNFGGGVGGGGEIFPIFVTVKK